MPSRFASRCATAWHANVAPAASLLLRPVSLQKQSPSLARVSSTSAWETRAPGAPSDSVHAAGPPCTTPTTIGRSPWRYPSAPSPIPAFRLPRFRSTRSGCISGSACLTIWSTSHEALGVSSLKRTGAFLWHSGRTSSVRRQLQACAVVTLSLFPLSLGRPRAGCWFGSTHGDNRIVFMSKIQIVDDDHGVI